MKLVHASLFGILIRILIGILLAAEMGPVAAQNPDAAIPLTGQMKHDPALAAVSGIVTRDPGGEPLKKTLVELIAENQATGGNRTALTGADGAFHIEDVAPGRYRLFAEHTGYLEVEKRRPRAEGRLLTLSAGQELKDVVIRLQATAVVEGRVTDEDGDPLAEAQVAVLRQTFASGHRHWEQAGGERTNDLGEYRIANLPAGSYYISVTPPIDSKVLIETADAASDSRKASSGSAEKPVPTSYKTTYYPGTGERSQAAPVDLRAGVDFPANFSLTPSPSLAIRGSIPYLAPGASALVLLKSPDVNSTRAAEVKKNGSFEIRDVSPGTYTLLATVTDASGSKLARQPVQVVSANLEGIRLTPQAGAWVHGHLRLESKSNLGRLMLNGFFLGLIPADPDNDVSSAMPIGEGFTPVVHVNVDGSFEWKDVPPGHYYVQFLGEETVGPDRFLKSVLAGGRDVTDLGFSVSGGAALLDVVASANGAVVEGLVSNAKGEGVANAVVVAAPERSLRSRLDRFHKTVSDQSGRFTLHGVPPGVYTLIAWESVDGEAYFDPEFLSKYEGQGSAVQVGEGERKSVQLVAIPSVEEPGGDQP